MPKRPLRLAVPVAAVAIAVLVGVFSYCWWRPHTTVILVRHAERASGASDSPLSAAGEQRAQQLVHVLGDAGITAVYATEFTRTQQTAEPLATALGLPMTLHDAGDVEGLVDEILGPHSGGVIFVAGHSNTVPEIIEELGASADPIAENQFDNLYVVEICRCQGVRATHLNYGQPDS